MINTPKTSSPSIDSNFEQIEKRIEKIAECGFKNDDQHFHSLPIKEVEYDTACADKSVGVLYRGAKKSLMAKFSAEVSITGSADVSNL